MYLKHYCDSSQISMAQAHTERTSHWFVNCWKNWPSPPGLDDVTRNASLRLVLWGDISSSSLSTVSIGIQLCQNKGQTHHIAHSCIVLSNVPPFTETKSATVEVERARLQLQPVEMCTNIIPTRVPPPPPNSPIALLQLQRWAPFWLCWRVSNYLWRVAGKKM